MPKFVPLSRQLHGDKTWKRAPDYRFAAKVPVVPIVAQEVAAASSEMPLGFVKTGELFELVALVSRRADENLSSRPTAPGWSSTSRRCCGRIRSACSGPRARRRWCCASTRTATG